MQGNNWEELWSPDKVRETGEKYGEEVCEILFSLGMPDVPNEVFPEGVKESC